MDLPELEFASPADPCQAASVLAPFRYVREADLALLYGSREQAIALIERAYLAFDLAAADCDEFMAPGTAWRERNN